MDLHCEKINNKLNVVNNIYKSKLLFSSVLPFGIILSDTNFHSLKSSFLMILKTI